ncbi:flagellar export protein FliJ [Lentibacillus sp. N15]|uniref:flagellar export protein FliJ n=1 Tax=Lentibacillus songyuanensis TaxID=3136161 RepID=UPI0031BAB7FC
MTKTLSLGKILHIREREKQDAQKAYHYSQERFEDHAMQLYTLLRKKEAAEASYETCLHTTTPINQIKEQLAYIEQLAVQIMQMQHAVQDARDEMELNQQSLTDAHVEVKKFEKIMELRQEQRNEVKRKEEKQTMDDISIQQYLRKNG